MEHVETNEIHKYGTDLNKWKVQKTNTMGKI